MSSSSSASAASASASASATATATAASTINILKERLQKGMDEIMNKKNKKTTTEDNNNNNDNNNVAVTESCQDCLEQLNQIDMTLELLSATLIGATVNKFKSHAVLGETAKKLIQKWKQIAKQQQQQQQPTPSKVAKASLKKKESSAGSSSSAVADDDGKDKNENEISATGSSTTTTTTSIDSSFQPSQEWADLPPNRQVMCEKFYPLLQLSQPALVKAGMKLAVIQPCLAKLAVEIEAAITAAHGTNRKDYTDKARSIAFNLKKNLLLSQDLVYGVTTADELVQMTPEQMASAEQQTQRAIAAQKLIDSKRLDWEQANEDKINKMCGIQGDLLKASLFTCGRCKSVKTTSTQKQTRSADEPMTVFVLCLNCGNRWKFS